MRNFVMMAAGTVLAIAPLTARAQRIAYLDSRRVLQEAPGASEARTLINGELARFDAQLKVLEDSVNAMLADYQRRSVLLSPDEKAKQEQTIIQRRQSMEQRAQAIRQQAGARQEELMQPVMDRVQKAIEDIRKEGGYSIIFDAQGGAMVAADSTLDLTVQVIERMKAVNGAASGAASRSSPRTPRNPPSDER
ncbi:MAG: OmpH family outer membrane protein [Gemmatimonadetes bacterium]|nr:OmpH family outer membrane protein [Gemmatimonadota bacterium]